MLSKIIAVNVLLSGVSLFSAAHEPETRVAKYDPELAEKELKEVIAHCEDESMAPKWRFFKASQDIRWRNAACLLLEQRADINRIVYCRDYPVVTPLIFATRRKNNDPAAVETATFLLDQGASVDHIDHFRGETALISASRCNNTSIMPLLLARNANINFQDEWGRTALMQAALYSSGEAVTLLLQAGADRAIKDDEGRTASALARRETIKTEIAGLQNHRDSIKR